MEAHRLDPRLTEAPPWLVRLYSADERVVGAGILVDAGHVLTCAHVVAAVLEPDPDDPRGAPPGTIRLDFPSVRDGDGAALGRSAAVVPGGWFPARDDGSGDFAILELAARVDPQAVPPAPLRAPRGFSGRPFSARGYPTGAGGIEATGELRGFGGPRNEWVQMENVRLTGARVEQGFSGGPVFATDLGAVVGIVVAERVGTPDERIAHMIPLSVVARSWPPFEGAIRWRLDLEPELSTHWLPRARGVEPDAESAGWYFTGRRRALAELAGWLAGEGEPDGRVRLVTGAPGSGKSAVLARLAVLADPVLGSTVPLDPGDEATRPPLGVINLAVHAKGRTLAGIIAAIAASAEVEAANADELIAALKARARPFTLVVDALDEAVREDIFRIANLLARLARDRDRVGIRVLVGARSGVRSGVVEDVRRGLDDVVEVRIDEAPYLEPGDLAAYVVRRLLLADSPGLATSYRGQDDLAGEVAAAVAARAHPLFLVAQLTALRLVDRAPIDTAVDGWATSFPTDVGGAFDLFLDDLGERRHAVRDVLTALAYAEGEGLPERGLWASVAGAISGREYRDADVLDAIALAASFLVTSTAPTDPHSAAHHRLFHRALDDHLRHTEDELARQHRITDALLASVPRTTAGERDWAMADSYLTTHLASHAHRAGRLDELLSDLGFLVAADLDRLLPLLPHAKSEEAREWAAILELASDRFRVANQAERPSYLEMAARQRGADVLADRVAAYFPDRPWRVPVARWRPPARHVPLIGHLGPVNGIAVARLEGRSVAVSCGDDRSVRLWDLQERLQIGEPLTGHENAVQAVALGMLEGRPIAVTAGGLDKTVRLWDLAGRGAIGEPLTGHRAPVDAVALGLHEGRPFAVTGDWDGGVRVWDLLGHAQIGKPLIGHTGHVKAIAVGTLDGRPVAISGAWDGTIRLWDVASKSQIGDPISVGDAWVHGLALVKLGDRSVVASAADAVQLWDLRTRTEIGQPLIHWNVHAVALGSVGGRTIAVSAGFDGSVRLWDVDALTSIGQPMEGHDGGVDAVALATVGDRAVAVSGGRDGAVRVWDLDVADTRERAVVDHGSVTAIALGSLGDQAIVISGSFDGTVQLWDLDTLTTIGDPMSEHRALVSSIVIGTIDGRQVAVSSSYDETIRLTDLKSRAQIGQPLVGHDGFVEGVGLGELGSRSIAVSTGVDGTVRVWDLEARTQIAGPFTGHWGGAIAVGTISGRTVAISGSKDNELREWDVEAGTQATPALVGHDYSVHAVALGKVDGRTIAVSGGEDRTIRFWDIDRHTELEAPRTGHTDTVITVAFGELGGQTVAVSGGADGSVRVWRPGDPGYAAAIFVGSKVQKVVVSDHDRVVAACDAGLIVLELR